MSDKTGRPGKRDAYRWRGVADGGDAASSESAEGHAAKVGRVTEGTHEPPSDEAEGRGISRGHATEGSDQPPNDDTEGHAGRRVSSIGGTTPKGTRCATAFD